MDASFLLLVSSVVFTFVNLGATSALLGLDPDSRVYRGKGLQAVGVPLVIGLVLTFLAALLPAFDVEPTALIVAAVLTTVAASTGLRPGQAMGVLRLVLLLGAAIAQGEAMIQAIGLR